MFRSSDASSYLTDSDYTNGEKYEYVTTLIPGEYEFSFEASDGGETVTRAGGNVVVDADDVPDGGDGTDGGDGGDGTDGGDGDDGGEGSDGDDVEDEYEPKKNDDEDTPGFSSVAVLGALAVVGAAMILARRRRDV